jgi:hypothetical protein
MRPTLLVLLFQIISFSSILAQSVFLSVGGGFSSLKPSSNYSFTYAGDPTSWSGKFQEISGQRADIGFNVSTSLEFQLPDAPVAITVGCLYTQLYGKADRARVLTPPWSSTIYTVGELTTRSNILTFQTGAQWQFLRSCPSPYVGLGLLYNIVGETKLSIAQSGRPLEAVVDGNTRLGISLDAGARLSLQRSLDVSIDADYSLINLVTPDSREEVRGLAGLTFTVHYRSL